jgi:hypothetical protein
VKPGFNMSSYVSCGELDEALSPTAT